MSKAMPLYVHPDLRPKGTRSYFFVCPASGRVGFSNGMSAAANKDSSPENIKFSVPENLRASVILLTVAEMRALVDQQVTQYGRLDPEFIANLEARLLEMTSGPEKYARMVSGEEALNEVDLQLVWKEGQNADAVCAQVVDIAARNGAHVEEEDIKEALLERLDEMQRAGKALSSEQREFIEEQETVNRMNGAPMRRKPCPQTSYS